MFLFAFDRKAPSIDIGWRRKVASPRAAQCSFMSRCELAGRGNPWQIVLKKLVLLKTRKIACSVWWSGEADRWLCRELGDHAIEHVLRCGGILMPMRSVAAGFQDRLGKPCRIGEAEFVAA